MMTSVTKIQMWLKKCTRDISFKWTYNKRVVTSKISTNHPGRSFFLFSISCHFGLESENTFKITIEFTRKLYPWCLFWKWSLFIVSFLERYHSIAFYWPYLGFCDRCYHGLHWVLYSTITNGYGSTCSGLKIRPCLMCFLHQCADHLWQHHNTEIPLFLCDASIKLKKPAILNDKTLGSRLG